MRKKLKKTKEIVLVQADLLGGDFMWQINSGNSRKIKFHLTRCVIESTYPPSLYTWWKENQSVVI